VAVSDDVSVPVHSELEDESDVSELFGAVFVGDVEWSEDFFPVSLVVYWQSEQDFDKVTVLYVVVVLVLFAS
jgi:hypothetical protein